jgi:hypothetical protein
VHAPRASAGSSVQWQCTSDQALPWGRGPPVHEWEWSPLGPLEAQPAAHASAGAVGDTVQHARPPSRRLKINAGGCPTSRGSIGGSERGPARRRNAGARKQFVARSPATAAAHRSFFGPSFRDVTPFQYFMPASRGCHARALGQEKQPCAIVPYRWVPCAAAFAVLAGRMAADAPPPPVLVGGCLQGAAILELGRQNVPPLQPFVYASQLG